MTYTADMNYMITLESGNWFSNFIANVEDRTVSFTYHDRRRAGQVARHYTIKFKADLSTVEDIVAVSTKAGRVEHFKSTIARETAANILRRAMMVKFENDFAEEVEHAKEEKPVASIIVNKMGVMTSVFAVIGFIITLCYYLFGEASAVEAVMNSLLGAEFGALVALFVVSVAMEVKHHRK